MRKITYLCLIGLSLLIGCRKEEVAEQTYFSKENLQSEERNENDIKNTEFIAESQRKEEILTEVSLEEKVAIYNGSIPISRPFIANAKYIFLNEYSQDGNNGVCRMKIGEESITKLGLDIPPDMQPGAMATDIYGNLHVVVSTKSKALTEENNRSFEIRTFDEDGILLNKIDLTYLAAGSDRWIQELMIDKDGLYYIKWGLEDADLFIINQKGELLHMLKSEELECEGMILGRGRNGKIYTIFTRNESRFIGILNGEKGCLEEIKDGLVLQEDRGEILIAEGTDTDLLLYSFNTGFWACDFEKESMEQRFAVSQQEMGADESISGWAVLKDGRFLLIKRSGEEWHFVYKAGGK